MKQSDFIVSQNVMLNMRDVTFAVYSSKKETDPNIPPLRIFLRGNSVPIDCTRHEFADNLWAGMRKWWETEATNG